MWLSSQIRLSPSCCRPSGGREAVLRLSQWPKADRCRTIGCLQVLDTLESTAPPSVDFFRARPGPPADDKVWAVYALLLEKAGGLPKLFVGSGTSPKDRSGLVEEEGVIPWMFAQVDQVGCRAGQRQGRISQAWYFSGRLL